MFLRIYIALACCVSPTLALANAELCPGLLPTKTGTVLYTSEHVVICQYGDGSVTVRNGRTLASISEGSVIAVFAGSGATKPETISALDRNNDGYLDLVTYDSNEAPESGDITVTDENADGAPDLRFLHNSGAVEVHTKAGWQRVTVRDSVVCANGDSTVYAWNQASGFYESTGQKCSNKRSQPMPLRGPAAD